MFPLWPSCINKVPMIFPCLSHNCPSLFLQKKNTGWWYTYPSEKWWSSSVGTMKFPTEWKNNPNVPNHQQKIATMPPNVLVACASCWSWSPSRLDPKFAESCWSWEIEAGSKWTWKNGKIIRTKCETLWECPTMGIMWNNGYSILQSL